MRSSSCPQEEEEGREIQRLRAVNVPAGLLPTRLNAVYYFLLPLGGQQASPSSQPARPAPVLTDGQTLRDHLETCQRETSLEEIRPTRYKRNGRRFIKNENSAAGQIGFQPSCGASQPASPAAVVPAASAKWTRAALWGQLASQTSGQCFSVRHGRPRHCGLRPTAGAAASWTAEAVGQSFTGTTLATGKGWSFGSVSFSLCARKMGSGRSDASDASGSHPAV